MLICLYKLFSFSFCTKHVDQLTILNTNKSVVIFCLCPLAVQSETVTEIYLLRWGTLLYIIAEIVFSHEFHLLLDNMINICYVENLLRLLEIIWELELCLDKFRDFIMNKENYWKCGVHCDWLIDYFLMSSKQYFRCIQDENSEFNIEMTEGMGLPDQQLLTATEKEWRVFQNLQQRSLACKEHGILQTCYPLWSTVRLSVYYNSKIIVIAEAYRTIFKE